MPPLGIDWNAAITGFVGGGLAGLLAPWIKWPLEKRRKLLDARRQRIASWRSEIAAAPNFAMLRHSTVWQELRSHMADQEQERFNTMWLRASSLVGLGADSDTLKKSKLLEIVARVEREWELI